MKYKKLTAHLKLIHNAKKNWHTPLDMGKLESKTIRTMQ